MEVWSHKPYGFSFSRALLRPMLRSELYRQIREDLTVYGGEWDRPGFRALAVHRFGAMLNHQSGALRSVLSVMYRFMFRYIRNYYGIELPATAMVGRRLLLAHQHGIVIHPQA